MITALALASVTPAEAARKRKSGGYNPPYAAIVVDAKNGRVLHQDSADAHRYPASLTKIMTLYILFEELQRGRVKLDTPMRATANAAAQPPSKLGLRPGDVITAEDAIKALVTKSANDVAVVIGEHIEGSESAFARRMTRTARAIGMTRTTFRNASGLPDSEQKTTARDLAVLARTIQEHYPRYFAYFSTRSFSWKGRVHGNHNKLLGRVPGVNGIKTGFIRASGFNLSTNVERDGRHIVAVVMGGRSGASRDARMRDLIEEYMPKATRGSYTDDLVARAEMPSTTGSIAAAKVPLPVAAPRDVIMASAAAVAPLPAAAPAPRAAAIPTPAPILPTMAVTTAAASAASSAASTATRPLAKNPIDIVASVHRAVTPAALSSERSDATPGEALALANTTTTPAMRWVEGPKAVTAGKAAVTSAQPVAAAASVPQVAPEARAAAVASANVPESVRTGWLIQVGATDDPSKAENLLQRAQSRASNALSRAEPFTEPVQKGEQTLYRARFAGFTEKTAQAACKALKNRDIACFAIRN
ncbi:penicillin-binding protein [Agaricicola taiwanensis]|uniref:Penicillin-binding protein n=1 Tax=Agaricicola taiwanensis TaxID=591372 RepID=A0A8J2YJL4_9RHOB|nr:D-alanyl-D-alanine carboxypeptidase [Agaricicola taiwanensis]GGE47352.1 penicillin-binding protein [Agaricicola taiwanensis]